MKTKGIYFLYRLVQALALPALLLYFAYRSLENRGYGRSLAQRFGFLPHSFKQTGPGAIWLHAVSVGEILSCVEFAGLLRAEFPLTRLFVSTSTLAGRLTAEQKLASLADGIFFLPTDYVFSVRRVLRTLKPSVVLIAETEIWPNLFREVKRTGASLAVVNARISDRAMGRYLRWRWFFRAVLENADVVLAQSDEIASRFVAIGAPPDRVRTAGNFKYDFAARMPEEGAPVLAWLRRISPSQVWVAASTTAEGGVDEDDAVVAAWLELRRTHPQLAMILAPRKPERFGPVAAKLQSAGIDFWRRSQTPTDAPVLLLDTIGELASLFSAADVVFMGGTLSIRGGHNILEPALFGKPVVAGPRMENFQAIADQFRAASAYVEISDAAALAPAVARLLDDREAASEIGRRALACAQASRGASVRSVAAVRELYTNRIPGYRPPVPWQWFLWLLSLLWRWGGTLKREKDLQAQKRLDVPVVSVGNLVMGGTGKTPCVLRLAELLKSQGRHPGILTRGYKRHTPHDHLIVPPGASVPAGQTGDEPQIFIRSGVAPVGVGADRWQTGKLLRDQFHLDVMLLDDGFQHLKLARDVDIVLIDALNPFGGGAEFPLGRLREPPQSLARAHIILITRAQDSDLPGAIEHAVRRWNPTAPIFRAGVEAREWVDNRSGRAIPVSERPFANPGVFCGLGNPQTFHRTLDRLAIDPVAWIDFEDHHRYRPDELRRIAHLAQAARAQALLTTEKDAVNLCDDCDNLLGPLPLYWLRIGMKIEREDDFLQAIAARAGL